MAVAKTTFPPSRVSAPDSGGRGTNHKIPTGGGGSGDWGSRPPGGPGPGDRLKRYRTGLAVLMISSLMLFGTLTFAFMGRKNARHFDERTQRYTTAWAPLSLPSLLWWNTLLLVISSATLEIARREHFRDEVVMDEWLGLDRPTLRRALPLEAVTLVLSIGFIVGQSVAWRDLYHQGAFAPANASSHFYLALTGLHALHLVGGMIVLVWAIVAGLAGISLESRQIAVDITAWYWHAITVVWFGIFALLLYGQ